MNRRDFLRHSTMALAVAASFGMGSGTSFAAATGGRTFYLDGEAGNDGAPGNHPQQAWRSITKLNSVTFQPGDRIYFKRGSSFPGQFHPQGSGNASQPVVVDSYGSGALPHIHAYGKAQCSVYLHNVEYWTLRNLQVSNKGTQNQGNRAGVYVHHEDFGVAHGIVLDGLYVHDVNGSPIKKQGAGAGIMVNATGKQRPSRYEGLQISNCSVINTQRNGIHFLAGGSREGGLGRNVIVRGNKIQQVPGDCILIIGCDGALVEHNTVSNCTELPPGEAAAGIWPFNSDNTLIQYNEVSGHQAHADGEAFDADLACNHTVIQYNYSHDNIGGLALICNMGNKNLGAGNTGTIVRYNVSINDSLRPSNSASVRITGPVEGSTIFNNIFIIPRRPSGDAGTLFKADNWQGVPNNTAIHDNIVFAEQSPGVELGLAQKNVLSRNTVMGPDAAAIHSMVSGLTAIPVPAVNGASAQAENLDGMLEKYRTFRPSLATVVHWAQTCFVNGKAIPNAYAVIENTAQMS